MCETEYDEQPQSLNQSNVQEFLASSGKQPIALKLILSSKKSALHEVMIQGQNLQCGATGGIWVASVNEHGYAETCRAYKRGHNGCAYRCSCQEQCHCVWVYIDQPAVFQITHIRNWRAILYW